MTEASSGAPSGPRKDRPLSPHLQVWRWHLTMAGSILHRASLIVLYFGALIVVGFLLSLALGEPAYQAYRGVLGSVIAKLLMFGLTVALFYNMASAVRHLFWDIGKGFNPKTGDLMVAASIAFAIVAALVVWFIAFETGAL